MNSKERIIATLEHNDRDRVPFWPKLTATYHQFQDEKYSSMKLDDLHKWIGSDVVHSTQVKLVENSSVADIIHRNNGKEQTDEYHIDGEILTSCEHVSTVSGDSHPVEYLVKSIHDLRLYSKIMENMSYKITGDSIKNHENLVESYPEQFFICPIPPSPVMDLCQYKIGLENFIYLMYDYPYEMDALIEILHIDHIKRLKLICENTKVKYILSTENTSTTLISPAIFEKYCLPQLTEYGHIMEHYDKKQILHMCGKLKKMLPHIDKIPAIAVEAFSSPSVGDTTIKDGYMSLHDKTIIGGTCATTWLMEKDKIVDTILRDVEDAGGTHRLFLSSGGVMPFSTTPDIIKYVWNKVKNALI